jgi:hypothetical protein
MSPVTSPIAPINLLAANVLKRLVQLATIAATWSQSPNLSNLSESGGLFMILNISYMTFHLDDEIRLFCWIIGGTGNSFDLLIKAHEIVSQLRHAILQAAHPVFKDIAAFSLDLWMVGVVYTVLILSAV